MSIEEWLEGPAERLHGYWMRSRVALLLVLIVNLALLVIVMVVRIHGTQRFVESQMFLGLEEPEAAQESREPGEAALRQSAEHSGWEEAVRGVSEVRNVVVDALQKESLDGGLRDEKDIDATKLYEDAARAQAAVAANRGRVEDLVGAGDEEVPNTMRKEVTAEPGGAYKGASVVSYSVTGRKARSLPVPAYKCEQGGMVVVDIEVDGEGRVSRASVDAAHSSGDECLQSSALEAARVSVFNAVGAGAAGVAGSITYMFVAQ